MELGGLYQMTEDLRSKYFRIYFVYFIFFLASGPLESITSYFYFTYFSTVEYGIFLTINNIINIVLPTVIASISYKTNAKLVNSIGVIIASLSGIMIGLYGDKSAFLLIALSSFLFLGRLVFNNSLGNKICYSIDEGSSSVFFSLRDLYLYGGISLGSLVSGFLISRLGYDRAFIVFSLVMLFSLFFSNRIDISKTNEASDEESRISIVAIIKKLIRNRVVICLSLIYLSSGVYATAYDFIGSIGLKLGIDVSVLLTFSGVILMINAISAYFISKRVTEHNRKSLFLIDIFTDFVPAVLFALSNSKPLFMLGLFISSIKDVFAPITFSYIVSCFNEEEGFMALALLGSISSLFSVIFPIIFGYMIENDSQLLFGISAGLILVSVLIAKVLMPDNKD